MSCSLLRYKRPILKACKVHTLCVILPTPVPALCTCRTSWAWAGNVLVLAAMMVGTRLLAFMLTVLSGPSTAGCDGACRPIAVSHGDGSYEVAAECGDGKRMRWAAMGASAANVTGGRGTRCAAGCSGLGSLAQLMFGRTSGQ